MVGDRDMLIVLVLRVRGRRAAVNLRRVAAALALVLLLWSSSSRS